MLKDFIRNFKALIRGELAAGRPIAPVERHTCYGCHERFEGKGFLLRGQFMSRPDLRYCTELCAPPFLREGYEIPNLYGDPR